jgi:hypothetical protein
MSRTNRQSDSARINGARSNGPKTDEGKARSSQNSLKHGLNSDRIVVLSNEKQEDYDTLHNSFLKRFDPKDDVELELVNEMVGARWRLRRIRLMETEAMDMRMEEHDEFLKERRENPTSRRRQAMAFKSLSDTSQSLNMLSRYETRLQRTYERAFDNLKKLRAFPYPEEPITPCPVIEMKPRLPIDKTNRTESQDAAEPLAPLPCDDKPATGSQPSPYQEQISERRW